MKSAPSSKCHPSLSLLSPHTHMHMYTHAHVHACVHTHTHAQARANFIARQKLGRLGTAEEIASLMVYLASDEVNYHNGSSYYCIADWLLPALTLCPLYVLL